MRPGTGYIALVVLVVIGVMGFTQFISGMTDLEMAEQQISRNPHMDHMWMTFGAFAAIAILWDYVPKWIERLKNTNLKRILLFGSFFLVVALAVTITPMKDMDYSEQKMIIMIGTFIAMTVFLIAAYFYQKKHPKKDEEDDPKKD